MNIISNYLMIMVVCFLTLSQPTWAEVNSKIDQSLSPYFLIEQEEGDIEQFPLEATEVTATIHGVIAEVTVRQTYKNNSSRPIHGSYIFPASTRAAVHGMQMQLGDQVIRARIKEKNEARATFQKARNAAPYGTPS